MPLYDVYDIIPGGENLAIALHMTFPVLHLGWLSLKIYSLSQSVQCVVTLMWWNSVWKSVQMTRFWERFWGISVHGPVQNWHGSWYQNLRDCINGSYQSHRMFGGKSEYQRYGCTCSSYLGLKIRGQWGFLRSILCMIGVRGILSKPRKRSWTTTANWISLLSSLS